MLYSCIQQRSVDFVSVFCFFNFGPLKLKNEPPAPYVSFPWRDKTYTAMINRFVYD